MGWRSKKQIVTNDDDINTMNKNLVEQIQEFAPKNYEEITPIANAMILQKPIKIDLRATVENDRRRIIDFLCGISYVVGFVVDKTEKHVYEFRSE